MSRAFASIRLEGNRRTYQPGQVLRGICRIHGLAREELAALEISVIWHTEGKGDEDLSVHFFLRQSAEELQSREEGILPFEVRLPHSPLSYDGVIVKIRWCVRLRVFLRQGKELVEEQPFRLGHLPVPDQVPGFRGEF